VQRVLGEIGAHDIPQILVFNKLDRLEASQRPRALHDWIELDAGVRTPRVFVSALTGEGLPELRVLLGQAVGGTMTPALNAAEAPPPSTPSAPADGRADEPARTGTFDSLPAP
jgi:GTP-binding protein HflX